jgi:hypothetical protein
MICRVGETIEIIVKKVNIIYIMCGRGNRQIKKREL